jgi:DNA-directed RNA polymerase subunit H (RpoH/RPB5)
MQNPNLINSIFKSRNVLIEQLNYMDYDTDDFAHFSISEVNAKYTNNQLDMLLEKKKEDPETGKKKKIYVLYYLTKLIRPNNLHDFIEDLFTTDEVLTKDDTLLIVSKDEVNDTLMAALKHIWETEGYFIVISNIKRLQFNIQEHSMVPKHRIMGKEEVDALMNKYNIANGKQLPEISRFDPVALSIYMRPGDVCEILRPSKSAILASYYRICV